MRRGLSEEQQSVLTAALEGDSLFLTGGAGTGKSFTLQHVIASLRKKYSGRPGAVAVVAPTGVAAIQVQGTTIHSWAGLQAVTKTQASALKIWKRDVWK